MNEKWCTRMIQATIITVALAAVCQEMEKPKEERVWHGIIAGFVPYDFRLPSLGKLRDTYWNPYDKRLLTPEVFGVGWAINFYTLLERLGMIGYSNGSEESFLMPNKRIKDLIEHPPAAE